jgi:hypothetical protein
MTQPLDVGVFCALKRYMVNVLQPLISTGISRVQKVEWLSAYVQAQQQAFSTQNICSGFCGTGIYPLEPEKVLNCLISLPPIEDVDQPSAPPSSDVSFHDAALTSSPNDFNATTNASAKSVELVNIEQPLSTPAKRFVTCLTCGYECIHTEKCLLQRENEDLKR